MIAVRENELLRHPAYTRVVHWSSAMFFVLALLSGFAIYSPWLFHWLTPLFGGGPMTRLLHPWFSLGFVLVFALQLLNWSAPMAWTSDDRAWLKQLKAYVLHDVAALVMLAGFIVHVYEGTAQQPGTFQAMTRGTVEKRWAWTHHPAWYRAVTGRDPRTDYERALQRTSSRTP